MRTQHQEGLLQVSFNFLHNALLHVVGAVTLIPLKHWQAQKNDQLTVNGYILQIIREIKNSTENRESVSPFCRWGTLFSDIMVIQVGTSVPFIFTPAS